MRPSSRLLRGSRRPGPARSGTEPSGRARSGSAVGLVCAALLAVPAAAHAGPRDPLYQWTDADGAVRYTTHRERIPLVHREHAVRVEPGRAAEENAAALPGSRTEPERPVPVEEWLEGGLEDDAMSPAPPPVEAAPAEARSEDARRALDARIAELEAAVERDETALEVLVSDPESAARLRESDALATIAERLPRLQRELRELRARREALAGPDGD